MKISILATAAFLSLSAVLSAAPTGLDKVGQLQPIEAKEKTGFSFTQLENGIQIHVNDITKNVIFYGPTTVRVNANLGKTHTTQPSIVVVGQPAKVSFKVKDAGDTLNITSDKLNIVVDKKSGALSFKGADGKELTRERTENPMEIKEVTISNAPTYDVKQTFTLTPDESLYGLGQYNQPYMDYRGKNVLMVQTNIGIVVPMLVSTKRYGIMWDIYSKATFKDDADGAHYWAESAPAGVDYYFFAGDTLDDVIASYRQLTGPAPMFAKAAFGFFMSKERYKTQARLIEVVKDFRKNEFPIDYIVQDWQYWGGDKDGTWSGMIWNKERYPDPAALTKTLHEELHVKLMNSIWPSVGNDTDLAKELDEKNLRFKPLHWISKKARVYDAYSPEGRAIYFKHIKKGLLDVGVDALWMDGTEVEVGGACHDAGGVERDIKGLGINAMGDFTRYLNPYTLLTTKGTYEGQRGVNNKRVFTLTRSAWTGSQRYAAVSWSGDTTASWNTLRNQIAGGINVAMSGQPYWTQDTGGFFVGSFTGGDKNTEWRELFARWNQFGIFNPIYRVHGCGAEREPYIFKTTDPDVYKSLLDAAHLRYRLLPYLYSMGWMSTNQGYTMMRGLPMDFPDDTKVRKTDDAYTFGPAFLVHPVTRAMYRSKDKSPAVVIPT
ncbi:TPA: glycoside hydrolase, partial [Candidatus Sumerlaeota bacterium]|nr:glycoside hydrolase [Candidatus Sumerlaeota bacterium]